MSLVIEVASTSFEDFMRFNVHNHIQVSLRTSLNARLSLSHKSESMTIVNARRDLQLYPVKVLNDSGTLALLA